MPSPVRHLAASAIAFAALLAPQFAFAGGIHLESSGIMFDTAWSQRAETLVSDVNGAATFSLVNAVDYLRFPNQFNYFNDYEGQFQLTARSGYKVTGYSLSGGFRGDIHVGQSPNGTQAVPEPHTYAMTLAGLALLAGVARRRKRAARAGVMP
ncbi:PEP-CTERM sorting domain-containing protein [Massilia sp. CCM 9210]|uniref:PEP-CTERM sorting domain-containing protein n=1 Tax=Massilia scottii TaxID=3057166 RepID=UPI0027966FEE|nr:PEP-CTERM sorting domain-containing protein [Massilia sp. CCM 9210]MDQ1813375.1 PEP-CTERM sorting domain-containing protein [Massilia sp. CCM 9210]